MVDWAHYRYDKFDSIKDWHAHSDEGSWQVVKGDYMHAWMLNWSYGIQLIGN